MLLKEQYGHMIDGLLWGGNEALHDWVLLLYLIRSSQSTLRVT